MSDDELIGLLRVKTTFAREPLQPVEELDLAGRSLAVTSELLSGVADGAGGARVKAPLRVAALTGRLLVGLARILVPGGLEGTLFRHWSVVATLVDLVLVVFALFGYVSAGFATLVTAYLVATLCVVEGTRYVARSRDGLRARALTLLGVVVLLVLILFGAILSLALRGWIRFGPTSHVGIVVDGLRAHGLRVGTFALGLAALLGIGAIWAQLAAQRRGRGTWFLQWTLAGAPLVLLYVLSSTARLILPASPGEGAAFLLASLLGFALLGFAFVHATRPPKGGGDWKG